MVWLAPMISYVGCWLLLHWLLQAVATLVVSSFDAGMLGVVGGVGLVVLFGFIFGKSTLLYENEGFRWGLGGFGGQGILLDGIHRQMVITRHKATLVCFLGLLW